MPSSTVLSFTLRIGSLPAATFRVHEFTLQEALSECYELRIEAVSGEPDIPYADLIGRKAALTVAGNGVEVRHCGRVTRCDHAPRAHDDSGEDTYPYTLVLEPAFKLLAYSSQNRVFLNKDIEEIVSEVLAGAGWPAHAFRFEARDRFPKRPFTVQYNETDLDFLHRLLEEEGIFYLFDHSGEAEVVVFANRVASYRPVPNTPEVPFHDEAGLSHRTTEHVTRIRRSQKLHTGRVLVKDYNWDTPEVDVVGRAAAGDAAEIQVFSPQVSSPDEADRHAQIKLEMLACGRSVLDGDSLCRSFRPGHRFKLFNAGPGFDGELLITRVSHRGDQREGFEGGGGEIIYTNHFDCIPAAVPFRPRSNVPKPKINGVITARVDGPESIYAFLDEQGRYRAKLPFDLTDRGDGGASHAIPRAQPYAGPDYGMHFPLHNGNDLLLAFIDGDADRPVALGAIPNPANPSPVTNRNKAESVIRTATGHQLRLDDTESKTAVDLTTHGKHLLSMNDEASAREIRLRSTDQNVFVLDDTQSNILIRTTDGGHQIKLDNANRVLTVETKYGHILTLDDPSMSLALQTKKGHILKFEDDGDRLTLTDGKGGHSIQIDAEAGTVTVDSEGDIRIRAKGTLAMEAAEILMEAREGVINGRAAQDVVFEGANIRARGDSGIFLEGGTESVVKAPRTTVAAEVAVEITAPKVDMKGEMTNVEASGVNSIQGPIVMIN